MKPQIHTPTASFYSSESQQPWKASSSHRTDPRRDHMLSLPTFLRKKKLQFDITFLVSIATVIAIMFSKHVVSYKHNSDVHSLSRDRWHHDRLSQTMVPPWIRYLMAPGLAHAPHCRLLSYWQSHQPVLFRHACATCHRPAPHHQNTLPARWQRNQDRPGKTA